jgi:F0F1-type ATP synthase assembly protein I
MAPGEMTSGASPASLAAGVQGVMLSIGLVVAVISAALFGYLAWRRTTSTMYYRSANSSIRPQHVRLEDYEEWVIVRRKRWRLVKTVVAALLGAAIGWLLVAMIGSGLTRS